MKKMDRATGKKLLRSQRNEITEHHIYNKLSRSMKGRYNKVVLNRVADDELRHYNYFRGLTGQDVKPNRFKIWWYFLISKLFGITFGVKMMEKGEGMAQVSYKELCAKYPDMECILQDEEKHEKKLIEMIDDDRLKYVGSIVRGLNDALVELTGALAGFTFVFRNPRVIAIIALITGISGSLSMSASEYLACKSEKCYKHPVKASAYSAFAFFFTVLFLVAPFFLLDDSYHALPVSILTAIVLISLFTYYISVAKELPFFKRFLEMAGISLGIAALTFAIGLVVRTVFHIDV